jgi:hypothetical protein
VQTTGRQTKCAECGEAFVLGQPLYRSASTVLLICELCKEEEEERS